MAYGDSFLDTPQTIFYLLKRDYNPLSTSKLRQGGPQVQRSHRGGSRVPWTRIAPGHTAEGLGFGVEGLGFRDGEENGNSREYRDYIGFYRVNGKEIGSY